MIYYSKQDIAIRKITYVSILASSFGVRDFDSFEIYIPFGSSHWKIRMLYMSSFPLCKWLCKHVLQGSTFKSNVTRKKLLSAPIVLWLVPQTMLFT